MIQIIIWVAASIYTLKLEAARYSKILVSYHIIIGCYNPECHDVNAAVIAFPYHRKEAVNPS